MDEALLRRLLGAGTLLTLALLFAALLPEPAVPEREGVVAYDVATGRRLGSQAPVENPPELRPDDHLATRPAQARAEPAEQAAAAPAQARPAPRPEALARPALKVDETLGGRGDWHVQVGSYSSQANARGALQKLTGMGLATKIQAVSVSNTTWFRVRIGPYPAERAALDALARVKKAGYPDAKIVRPDSVAKGN